MSRIGIRPVMVPEGVTVEISPIECIAKGPLGEMTVAIPHGVKVSQKDNKIIVSRVSDVKLYKALHGTIRSLINNAVIGVKDGFTKKLEMIGIGYRGALEGTELVLQVGFTHPVRVVIPDGLTVKMEKNVISVQGRNKHQVGQFCANVRAIREPDPYKGKGIRYQGEKIRMKQGKAAKAA